MQMVRSLSACSNVNTRAQWTSRPICGVPSWATRRLRSDPSDSAVFCPSEVFRKYITGVLALKIKHETSPLLSSFTSYGGASP
jgi:hypothetical protein